MSQYPIVEHRALGPATKQLFRGSRRGLEELPPRPAGTQLVAAVDGQYVTLPGQLQGTERDLVAASSLLVVDTRPSRQVVVHLELDSKVPGESFTVRVTFSCSVTDAAEAARRAPEDLVPSLESHLKSDAQLLSLGSDFDVENGALVREHVTARIEAFCMGRRPPAPGIRVELASIEIDTPEDLRRHAAALREQQRRHELDRLADEYSFEQARLFEELIRRGPEAVEGFFLKLDDPRFAASAERSYARREALHDRLMRLAQMFSDRGQFDTAPVDTPKLIDALVNTFLPAPKTGEERVSYTLSDEGASGERQRLAPNDSPEDQSPPPDEDALGG